MNYFDGEFDIAVVGAGHAGCEAALASARMGLKTLMITLTKDAIAFMPCNPAIGGTSKGHLVREIDALGGQMGISADACAIQMKMLCNRHRLLCRYQTGRLQSLNIFTFHRNLVIIFTAILAFLAPDAIFFSKKACNASALSV